MTPFAKFWDYLSMVFFGLMLIAAAFAIVYFVPSIFVKLIP